MSTNNLTAPQPYGLTSVVPLDRNAEATRARLAREDYWDWQNTFRPIENELIAQYDNPAQRQQAQAQAQQMALQGLASAEAQQERRMRGFGIEMTPEQKQAADRQSNLTTGLALVNAANVTQRRSEARDEQLLTGMQPQGAALRYAQGN